MHRLDPLVFTSVWVALAAAALCAASGPTLGGATPLAAVALAFCGTLVVYNVDRLRDLARDRDTAPARSRFVERHRGRLTALVVVAGLASAALSVRLGSGVVGVLSPVLLAGLFHRRLKRYGWWKPFYVSAAWTAVGVGLPAVALGEARHAGWVAAVVATTVSANVVASNLRDDEAVSARFGADVPLRIARGSAVVSALVAGLGPDAVRPLVCIPLATLAALAAFRRDERYGLVVVDGALWVGALLAAAWGGAFA